MQVLTLGERRDWASSLATLRKHPDLLGESERALVLEREAEVDAARVSLASRRWFEQPAWEDHVLAFLRTPAPLRERAVASADCDEQRHAFRMAAAVEGHAPSAHAAVRAVRAAIAAKDLDDHQAWELVRPHVSTLSAVPFLAADLARWRGGATAAPREILASSGGSASAHARGGGLAIALVSGSSAPVDCQRGVAARTLRAQGREWIVHVSCWGSQVELWLKSVANLGAVVGLRLTGREPFRLNRALVHEGTVWLVDMADTCHAVTWPGEVVVEDRGEITPLPHDAALGVCGDQVVLRATSPPGTRREAVMAGGVRPFTVRSEGSTLVRTDAVSGRRTETELPKGVTPHLVVESPRGESHPPLIVERSGGDEPAFVWWRPRSDLWRGFRLEAGGAGGDPTEAHCLPGRGVMVMTRDRSGLLVQRVCVERGGIVAGRATRHERAIGVTVDAGRKRCWLCVLDQNEPGGFHARPLSLEAGQTQPRG